MGAELLDMRAYLRALAPGPIWYFPNPGNAGDSLIGAATFDLLREEKIDYHLFRWEKFDGQDKTIVLGGGGGLVPYYDFTAQFIARFASQAKHLIILPHSVSGHEELLSRLGANVTLICREPVSFEHVCRHAPRAEVCLSEDLALLLNARRLLADEGEYPTAWALYWLKRGWSLLTHQRRRGKFPALKKLLAARTIEGASLAHIRETGSKRLNAFRADAERTGMELPPDNVDVSRVFGFGTRNEQLARYSSRRMLRFLDLFEEISTNRLHVAIASGLLGKRVRLHPNAYFKCQAVYAWSLQRRFEKIEWVGSESEAAR